MKHSKMEFRSDLWEAVLSNLGSSLELAATLYHFKQWLRPHWILKQLHMMCKLHTLAGSKHLLSQFLGRRTAVSAVFRGFEGGNPP